MHGTCIGLTLLYSGRGDSESKWADLPMDNIVEEALLTNMISSAFVHIYNQLSPTAKFRVSASSAEPFSKELLQKLNKV